MGVVRGSSVLWHCETCMGAILWRCVGRYSSVKTGMDQREERFYVYREGRAEGWVE